ncbi:MAG: hypothetical protein Q7R71_01820 [bacterium]|nr:hypothetical protein [bacterium]
MRYETREGQKWRLSELEKSAPRWMWTGAILGLVGALLLLAVTVAHGGTSLMSWETYFNITAIQAGWVLVVIGALVFVRGLWLEREAADYRTNLASWPN